MGIENGAGNNELYGVKIAGIMKKIWSVLFAVSLLPAVVELAGCKKSNGSKSPDPPPPPVVTTISPQQGEAGTVVTIKGVSFGNEVSRVHVTVNGVDAPVDALTDTTIKIKVPFKAGSGQVNVLIGAKELAGPRFTYIFSKKDIDGTVWAGTYKDGDYVPANYVMELNADGTLIWHDYSQSLYNGYWKVEKGQIYFTFTSSNSTVKADITDDLKLKNIQNNIYNVQNGIANKWLLEDGELNTKTDIVLDNTTWKCDKNGMILDFRPDGVIYVYQNGKVNGTSKYLREAGVLRFDLILSSTFSFYTWVIIKPDGRIYWDLYDAYFVKTQ